MAKEDAAIRENVGSKFDSATRFRAADEVDAENFANVEIEQEDEELDSQLLDAEVGLSKDSRLIIIDIILTRVPRSLTTMISLANCN